MKNIKNWIEINKKTIEKISVGVSLLILILLTISMGGTRGATIDMYAEIYDRDGTHITNVVIEKYSITRRVFEFDTSSFEGASDVDISDGMIFVFKDDIGNYEYSGFMKNITQDENGLTKFKGDDLRTVFNTEIILDFTQSTAEELADNINYISVQNMFYKVYSAVDTQYNGTTDLKAGIYSDSASTAFLGNHTGSREIVNAWSFLKVYLAYYNYYISAEYLYIDETTLKPTVKFWFLSTVGNTEEIRLDDFTFDKTTSEVKSNNTIAVKSYNVYDGDLHSMIYSSQELFDATPTLLQHTFEVIGAYDYTPYNFTGVSEDYSLNQVFKVIRRLEAGGTIQQIFYMQLVEQWYPSRETVRINYYLGSDNNIYIDSIPDNFKIEPTITKIYEDDVFSNAQYEAIWELVNSRYIEYIVLTDNYSGPLDITEFELYQFITVYDSEGTMKVVPVSEITYTNNSYKVKLGFKKTLLTEIIKGGN